MPAGFGPNPLAYFSWPPAVTVNSVRPWNALFAEITRIFARAVPVVRVASRELQRRLVGLGARIAEEHALGECGVDRGASRGAATGSLVNQFDVCQSFPACSVSARTSAGWQ